MSALIWKDETVYSQSDKVREPRTWTIKSGNLAVTVTRKVYDPGAWYAICHALGIERRLADTDLPQAKRAAKALVASKIAKLAAEFEQIKEATP